MVSVTFGEKSVTLPLLILLSIHFASSGYNSLNNGANYSGGKRRPEVSTPNGKVRGVNMVSRRGRDFFGFMGVPFAQPPLGNLRFKAPLPPRAWNGTLDASKSYTCIQNGQSSSGTSGSEDCLHLNIYTPRLPATNRSTLLPVMVYFHGGAFKHGSIDAQAFGPQYILDKDVILVLCTYRLGIFGFFSTDDEVASGNWAFKDMVRALEWNRDNIRYFGGDPNRVTIFGESAGAISIHLLALSPLSNGLFHNYITESGSALGYDCHRPKGHFARQATRVGKHLGCPTNTSSALVNCLRNFKAAELLNTDSLFQVWKEYPTMKWGPTIEVKVKGAFLTEAPVDLIDAGKIRNLPWLYSLTRDDGLVFTAKYYTQRDEFEEFLDNIDFALPVILTYDSSVKNVTAYTEALKSYYLNDLNADRTLLLDNFTQLIGDGLFSYPTYKTAQKHLVHAKTPQYFSTFEYRGNLSFSYLYSCGSPDDIGVAHSDQTIYLFQRPTSLLGPAGSRMSKTDYKMVDTMVQLWTSFAINGRPSTKNLNTTVIWEPYSSRKNYLRIGNNSDPSIGVRYKYLEKRMQFWEELTAATSWN